MSYYSVERSTSLSHHGILGQKWGVRRYQNKDGSLTDDGRVRLKARGRIVRSDKSTEAVESIINGMSKKERDYVLAGSDA